MKLLKKSVAAIIALSLVLLIGFGMLAGFGFAVSDPVFAQSTALKVAAAAAGDDFSWDNATVYFMLTDRFYDGDPTNNSSYGRVSDKNNILSFNGGDLKGVTKKIEEGYFDDLGVNAIWITAPYEQMHGFVNPNHYSYHGYYGLDFSNIDANMGTEADLETLVDTAHEHGIRIVMDVVMNHLAYNTLADGLEYDFGVKNPSDTAVQTYLNLVKNKQYTQAENQSSTLDSFWDYNNASKWTKWYGADWVRAGMGGYNSSIEAGSGLNSDQSMSLSYLPDVRTESTKEVTLMPILETKWKAEGRYEKETAELDTFFTKTGLKRTPRNHMIKWLTDWVREYGIDGFRCDTVKHVEPAAWKVLQQQAVAALDEWKINNPAKKLDDEKFWMTAEYFGLGAAKDTYCHVNAGFDSVINFDFQSVSSSNVSSKYSSLANINASSNWDSSMGRTDWNVLSYVSSHDTTLCRTTNATASYGTGLLDGYKRANYLLMAPGAVQIYYGDESDRPFATQLWSGRSIDDGWKDQRTRTFMNWSDVTGSKAGLVEHWGKLGRFRRDHLAVGAGTHSVISSSPYTFARKYNRNGVTDNVIIAMDCAKNTSVSLTVSSAFSNGDVVTNAYTGDTATVTGGKVTFNSGAQGIILIEEDQGKPKLSAALAGGGTEFTTETATVTLSTDTPGATYSVDGATPAVYTNGQVITVGGNTEFGESVTITLTATNSDGKTSTVNAVFKKKDPAARQGLVIHFKPYTGWSGTPNIYLFSGGTASKEYAGAWPGVPMTAEGNGWYTYNLTQAETAYAVFNDSPGSNQYPKFGSADVRYTGERWVEMINASNVSDLGGETVIAKYVDAATGETLAPPIVYKERQGTSGTVSKIDIDGYRLKAGNTDAHHFTFKGDGSTRYITFEYEKLSCTVTFMSQNEIYDTKTVDSGGKVTLPQPPDVPGKTFLGWFTSGDDEFDPNTEITADLTLTAKFEDQVIPTERYTVTFRVDGSQYAVIEDVISGSTVTLPAEPTKSGKLFVGWYTSAGQKFDAFTEVTASVIVDARFEDIPDPAEKFTVTFKDSAGGTLKIVSDIQAGGRISAAEFPAPPQLSNMVFIQWEEESGTAFDANSPVLKNMTVTAVYKPAGETNFNVEFIANGQRIGVAVGVPFGGTVAQSESGLSVLPSAPNLNGKYFIEWRTSDGKTFTAQTVVKAFTVVTAVYGDYHSVQYLVDAQVYTSHINIKEGATTVLPNAPQKDGFTFIKWVLVTDHSIEFSASYPISENLIVTAVFEENRYTVTFMDGETRLSYVEDVRYGQKITMPENPVRKGYEFTGWFDSEGNEFTAESSVTADVVLTAGWKKTPPKKDGGCATAGANGSPGAPIAGMLLVVGALYVAGSRFTGAGIKKLLK